MATDSTHPRQISPRKAADQRVKARPAASQAGTAMPNKARPKNARNSCISSGVPCSISM
ncbi:hypothetical protein D3C87_2149420 [compost metagenome]